MHFAYYYFIFCSQLSGTQAHMSSQSVSVLSLYVKFPSLQDRVKTYILLFVSHVYEEESYRILAEPMIIDRKQGFDCFIFKLDCL